MGFSFFQIVVTNVDDVTADGLGRHQGQIVVLGTAVDAEVCLVDGSLINGVRNRLVDKLTVIQTWQCWKLMDGKPIALCFTIHYILHWLTIYYWTLFSIGTGIHVKISFAGDRVRTYSREWTLFCHICIWSLIDVHEHCTRKVLMLGCTIPLTETLHGYCPKNSTMSFQYSTTVALPRHKTTSQADQGLCPG